MRLCNDTITVYNARFDPETDRDVYCGTVITGVSWYGDTAASVDTSGGLQAATAYTIRIPTDADFGGKSYCDPVAYAASDPAAVFTLSSGDIIVKGAAEADGQTPASLQRQYAEHITVLTVTDNRRGGHAPHWKVVGK